MELIIGRKGQQPFAIEDKAVSGKHLKLTTLPDGNIEVEDMGSSNGTFIDNVRIIKKVVSRNTIVRMGPTYSFCIKDVIPEVKKPQVPSPQTPPQQTPVYSIRHLKNVWDDYESENEAITAKTQKRGKMRLIPMTIGTVSGIFSPFVGAAMYVTVPIAIISFCFLFRSLTEKDTSYEDKKAAKDKLISKYICPNPNCRRTLPLQDYSVLSQNTNCPYCKCKWTK